MENTTQTPQLSLQDIANLKQLVEVACARGTFKAEEMKSVGTVYEKVDTFLKSVESAQTQAQPADVEPASDTTTDQ